MLFVARPVTHRLSVTTKGGEGGRQHAQELASPLHPPPTYSKLNNNTMLFTYYNMKNCDQIKTHIQGHDFLEEDTSSVAFESTTTVTFPSKSTTIELYP